MRDPDVDESDSGDMNDVQNSDDDDADDGSFDEDPFAADLAHASHG
jgi:hypothetical protein